MAFILQFDVIYGDSIETLKQLPQAVEVFINDSDHSAEYEEREYQIIESKRFDSIILGDNAHVTQKLASAKRPIGNSSLFQRWSGAYPGAGVGIAVGK